MSTKKMQKHATKKAKYELSRIRRAEDARRRAENPGNGTAFESAQVFLGTLADQDKVLEAIRHAELLDSLIDAVSEKADEAWAAIHYAIGREWFIVRHVLQSEYHRLREIRLEALQNKQSIMAWLDTVEQSGHPLHRVWVKKYMGARKLASKGKGISPKPMRHAKKVAEKEHINSFSVLTFSPNKINAAWAVQVTKAAAWRPLSYFENKDAKKRAANQAALKEARLALSEAINLVKDNAGEPFRLDWAQGRITRLPETRMTEVLGIDVMDPGVHHELVVLNHGFEEFFSSVHNKVWAEKEDEAEKLRAKVVKALYRRLAVRGAVIGKDTFRFLSSSSSHQKTEKVVFGEEQLLKVHEDYLFFGNTLEQFAEKAVLAPQFLKAVANRTRPDSSALTDLKTGETITVFDILPVADVKRVYHHGDALTMGVAGPEGRPWIRGAADQPVILGDGQMIALTELSLSGQLNGEGWKGLIHDSSSAIDTLCTKWHLTREEFFDLEVETFDGRRCRVGDYKVICGEGCWKFDKIFGSYAEYLSWIKQLMPVYPGIERLSILRQIDDEEGERKTRRLTRSLIQQFIWADNHEIDSLIKADVRRTIGFKRADECLRVLAGLDKTEDERSDLEWLLSMYPELMLNENVQKYIQAKFECAKKDGMANRLRTKGQFPYLIQDPVALLEVWVLGLDPNRNDLGVLKTGEISLNEVPDGEEVAFVRFPANYLTVRVLTNRAMVDAFATCGNCAVLSIYDDCLIRNDGDVDGDEGLFLYDQLVIKLIKRMIAEFEPPVIVFEHGSKAKPVAPGSVAEFHKNIGDALYKAHHDGQVGIYANVARDCAYMMAYCWVTGDYTEAEKYYLEMAAASTGAILAIDQVKGNDINVALINWLAAIRDDVRKAMGWKQPYTQQFLKKDVGIEDCLEPNEWVITDRIAIRFAQQVGDFAFDSQGLEWDPEKVKSQMLESRWDTFSVRNNVLNDSIIQTMRANYFNDENMADGTQMDAKLLERIKAKQEVGLKDVLLFWWHNERAMKNRLESKFMDVQEDFYDHCRKVLLDFACGNKKPNGDGHIRSKTEEMTSLYNRLVDEALELTRINGVDDPDGSYTWFILKVIAPWARSVVSHNNAHGADPAHLICSIPDAEQTEWDRWDE